MKTLELLAVGDFFLSSLVFALTVNLENITNAKKLTKC